MLETRALIRGDNVGDILERATTVHNRPPRHWLSCAPRIHVSRDAQQQLRAVRGQLSPRFGNNPVVTDRATDPADRSLSDRKHWLIIIGQIVWAGVDFVRDPRVR